MAYKGLSRRDFISKSTLGLLTTGLHLPLLRAGQEKQKQSYKFIYRTLGRTKLRIPIVSFGVMNSDSPDLIRKALDMGIKHLDTAHGYLRGNSEKVIGQIVQERNCRDKVYISTKVFLPRDREKEVFLPEANEEKFNEQLNISLQRLRTDYVDILYLHNIPTVEMVNYEATMKALEKAKKAGKARFIGFSAHTNEPAVIRAAVKAKIYDVVLSGYNFMKEYREELKQAIKHAADNGVGIIAMKTQCGAHINKKTEVNHAAALKWVLNDENVCTAIPGMTTFEQMDLNISVMSSLELTAAEKREIELTSMIKGTYYCQDCRSCIPSCPKRVMIPTLMRAFMYAEGYGNIEQARATIAELPERHSLALCNSCSSCVATCRHGIDIHNRILSLMDRGFAYC
jgi:predicted aldo/keto reductase-like oxidoreductase